MMRLAIVPLIALLAACQPSPEAEVTRAAPPAPVLTAPEDACWAVDRIPAVTETRFQTGANGAQVPQTVELRPAEDRRFTVPCAGQMTQDLIASLQRALTARGHYAGPVTGAYDAATAEGVRRYQAPLGLNSGILSLDGAQLLGLMPVPRPG